MSHARLHVEQLEGRVTPCNSAPFVHWLDFNITSPGTNHQIEAHVGATDADNDEITFRYDWKVNGVIVQTVTTNQNTDTLDLSQPGFGDKGDVISVAVTPMDPYSTGETVSISTSVGNSPPILSSIADLDLVEGDEVDFFVSAVDADGDELTFDAEDLPPGLIITPYNSTSARISGTVGRHNDSDPTKVFATRIIVSDGTDVEEQFCQVRVTDFTITTCVVSPPAGFNGTFTDPVQFSVTITGVGAPPVARTGTGFYWCVAEDENWGWDDRLTSPAWVTPTATGANGAWTITRTFWLHRNSSNHVCGADWSSDASTANIFVHLEGTYLNYPNLSNRVTVTAVAPPE